MLVITRKKGESILLGNDIEITIIKLDDGSVKLAIDAPKNVTILRKELFTQVQDENRNATEFNMDVLKKIKK
jgi:carbon storage regulator